MNGGIDEGSKPRPFCEACGLTTGVVLMIPDGPDSGIFDFKSPPFAVDADPAISLESIQLQCTAQCLGSCLTLACSGGESGGHANHFLPGAFPKLQCRGRRIAEQGVGATVMGQHGESCLEQPLADLQRSCRLFCGHVREQGLLEGPLMGAEDLAHKCLHLFIQPGTGTISCHRGAFTSRH